VIERERGASLRRDTVMASVSRTDRVGLWLAWVAWVGEWARERAYGGGQPKEASHRVGDWVTSSRGEGGRLMTDRNRHTIPYFTLAHSNTNTHRVGQ
jgi:hypothetical protein